MEVRVLANLVCRDLETTIGRNIRTVMETSGLDPWQTSQLKVALASREIVEVFPQDKWRVDYLSSLLRQIKNASSLGMDDKVMSLKTLIDSLMI